MFSLTMLMVPFYIGYLLPGIFFLLAPILFACDIYQWRRAEQKTAPTLPSKKEPILPKAA